MFGVKYCDDLGSMTPGDPTYTSADTWLHTHNSKDFSRASERFFTFLFDVWKQSKYGKSLMLPHGTANDRQLEKWLME